MKLLSIILLLICITIISCKPSNKCLYGTDLYIINKSNKKIYFNLYWLYPDSIIGEYNPIHNGTDGLDSNESFNAGNSRSRCWSDILNDNKHQFIHFFDADSLAIIPWDTIRKTHRGLLEIRTFDFDYLQSHNWTITYP